MVNLFIASRNAKTALVIDADTLLSSLALHKAGMLKKNITVLNNDPDIVAYAKSIGFKAFCGISTCILDQLKGKFDVIYWDYCGFPQRRADGFDPSVDMMWGSQHLTVNGIMLSTFCRRATNCIEKAENMIPKALLHAKTYLYHETCAMMLLIMVRKNPRKIRDAFNKLTMAVTSTMTIAKSTISNLSVKPLFNLGDVVFSKWGEQWLPGTIAKKVGASKFDVHFEKSNSISLMEKRALVLPIHSNQKIIKGDVVFSKWEGEWLPGTVRKKVGSTKYDIFFEKSNEISLMEKKTLFLPGYTEQHNKKRKRYKY